MPAILSHHLFGRTLLAQKNNRAFLTRDARDAFLLGNQGPDPLFYGTLSTRMINVKKLGVSMHREGIDTYLEAWRELLDHHHIKDHEHEILKAYVYGYLCHFALDRTAHPYVDAYTDALCSAGVPGLGLDAHSFVHSQIEADLDVYLLYRLAGRTIDQYCIPKQVLYASDAALSSIDALYGVAARILKLEVPRAVFSRSVKEMRSIQKLLYSPGGTRRKLVGRLERLVRPHSIMQALSHRPEAYLDAWYANEEHAPWFNNETGEESTLSYYELFEEALAVAREDMDLFKEGAPIREISKGQTFRGTAQECESALQGTLEDVSQNTSEVKSGEC